MLKHGSKQTKVKHPHNLLKKTSVKAAYYVLLCGIYEYTDKWWSICAQPEK